MLCFRFAFPRSIEELGSPPERGEAEDERRSVFSNHFTVSWRKAVKRTVPHLNFSPVAIKGDGDISFIIITTTVSHSTLQFIETEMHFHFPYFLGCKLQRMRRIWLSFDKNKDVREQKTRLLLALMHRLAADTVTVAETDSAQKGTTDARTQMSSSTRTSMTISNMKKATQTWL